MMIAEPGNARALFQGRSFGGAGRELLLALQQGKDKRTKRLVRIATALALLLPISFFLGRSLAWDGAGTNELTLEDALRVIRQHEEWARENGVRQLHAHARKVVETFGLLAVSDGQAGEDATYYVGHLALQCMKQLADVRATHPDIVAEFRPQLRAANK